MFVGDVVVVVVVVVFVVVVVLVLVVAVVVVVVAVVLVILNVDVVVLVGVDELEHTLHITLPIYNIIGHAFTSGIVLLEVVKVEFGGVVVWRYLCLWWWWW